MKLIHVVLIVMLLILLVACSSDGTTAGDEPITTTFILPGQANATGAQEAAIDTDIREDDTEQGDVFQVGSLPVDSTNEQDMHDEDTNVSSTVEHPAQTQSTFSDSLASENSINLEEASSRFNLLIAGGELPTTQAQSVLDPSNPAASLVSRLTSISSIVLLSFNQKLSSGERLTPTESNCLYDYDLAEGKPLLGVSCLFSNTVDEHRLLSVRDAAFLDTEDCRNALRSQHTNGCELHVATVQIRAHRDSSLNPQVAAQGRPDETYDQTELFDRPLPASILIDAETGEAIELSNLDAVVSAGKESESLASTIAPESSSDNSEVNDHQSADGSDNTVPMENAFHEGSDIKYRVDGTDLNIEFRSEDTRRFISCSLDVTTAQLTSENADGCDKEFKRIVSRIDAILGTLTQDL